MVKTAMTLHQHYRKSNHSPKRRHQYSIICFVEPMVTYTTSLHILISSLSLNHHICADTIDTQFFFSFYPLDFDVNITLLQNVSTTDLFVDYCKYFDPELFDKTDLFLIGLKQQLSTIQVSQVFD